MTLNELLLEVRQRANMEDSGFVTDAELTSYINASSAELYDLLVGKFQDYYTIGPVSFSISSSNTYDLPSDFYKLRGIDFANDGGNFIALQKFNFNERNKSNTFSIIASDKKYRIVGSKVHISPASNAIGDYQIWYIPQSPKLVSGTDVLNTVQGYEEYVVVDAAIKCLQKEESDTSILFAQKQMLIARIEGIAGDRDAGEPESVTILNRGCKWD